MSAGVNDDAAPPDDFRELSIIPSRGDIYIQEQPFLRRNIIEGRYRDVDHYLDVQFRLLREDFIKPLRDGIQGKTAWHGKINQTQYISSAELIQYQNSDVNDDNVLQKQR